MTNHSKALYLIQKALDRRRNALANLLAKPDSKPREVQLARGLIEAYESSMLTLRRDEAGQLSEGAAYERYSPDPVDNEQRAAWAMAALRHYASLNRWGGEEVIEDGDSEHLDEVAGDLMNDLYHLLADHKLDPQVLHERALMGYEEERAEEAQDDEDGEDDLPEMLDTTFSADAEEHEYQGETTP
jgi:hypothetical protein